MSARTLDELLAEQAALWEARQAVPLVPIEELIAASSLGTPGAVAARDRVPAGLAERVVDRVRIACLTEERDRAQAVAVALEQQTAAVLQVVAAAEHAALAVRDPRPVPSWCTAVRRALDETGRGCGCQDCETAPERSAQTAERADAVLAAAWEDTPWAERR